MAGNVIIITGGSSGYGKGTAKLFIEKGENVVITGRNESNLKKAAGELGSDYFVSDVTKYEDWEKLYGYVIGKYGRIDLLLNNAGCGVNIAPFTEQSAEDIKTSIDVNLTGMIWGCKVFVPKMIEQKKGTIINVASVCARLAWPDFSIYSAAKWGMLGFSKVLYTELREHNIRVTCFIPGAGDTNFAVNSRRQKPTVPSELKPEDVARGIADIFYLPQHVVIEEVTMWGIDQKVIPL